MNFSRNQLFSALALLASAVWIWVSAPTPGTTAASQSVPLAGFMAPDFTLETLDGESITLSDLRGQPVLVNLWASWCGPCRAEMPAMQEIYERYKDQGFVILAVNATNQDDVSSARTFTEGLGITYPVLLDVNGDVSDAYRLRSLPSSFFIDREGRIVEVVIGGPMAEALLAIRAEELLEGQP